MSKYMLDVEKDSDEPKYDVLAICEAFGLHLKSSDAEINEAILKVAAEIGLPLPTEPIEPKYLDVPERDLMVYECGSKYFRTREAAENFQAVLSIVSGEEVRITWDHDYKYKHVIADTCSCHESISGDQMYSARLWDEVESKIVENTKMRKAFESTQKENQRANEGLQELRTAVFQHIWALQAREYALDELAKKYGKFREDAEQNPVIADRFFTNTYQGNLVKLNVPLEFIRSRWFALAEGVTVQPNG